ncbi:TPA: hypothetical protein P2R03_003762 [Aeromonas veronii]|nr:hypothetical protein [Aeromonas veronii]
MKQNLKDEHLELISKAVERNLFIPQNEKISTIFLCGADINDKNKARSKVAKILGDKKSIDFYTQKIFLMIFLLAKVNIAFLIWKVFWQKVLMS